MDQRPTTDVAEAPGPATSRRDRRTARTRRAILDAARELIDEQGYTHTTIDQIAERADVAARTFFRHFPTKEAILFAHVEEHRRGMLDAIAARPADEHPFRAVMQGLDEFCSVVADQRESFDWAFRIIREHDLVYEQTLIKAETCQQLGNLIAARLGVDPAHDPRPHAWAVVAFTLFGNAIRAALEPDGSGDPRVSFRTLVADTAGGFAAATEP